MWRLKSWRWFRQKVQKPRKLSEYKISQKTPRQPQRNFKMNELFIKSMLSILKYFLSCLPLLLAFSTSPQPPTPSPSLYIYLRLSLPISCRLLHWFPDLLHPNLTVRVTESYPSCHHKGNVRVRQGETGGGNRMMLLAVHASALACCDTRKHPILHPRSIFVIEGCQWRHSTWVLVYPNTRHTAHLSEASLKSIPTHCIQPATGYMAKSSQQRHKVKWRVFTNSCVSSSDFKLVS